MVLTLGVHIGHHTSCAVVRDGEIAAAVQLERISRQKYHVTTRLSNDLPIDAVLSAAGAQLADVDLIVTSFASASPGGIGMHRPIIAPDFSLFDPWDERHRSISHHLAHARYSFEASGFDSAAVLVCDFAGSTTIDGGDYDLSFKDWANTLTIPPGPNETKTEWLSIYRASLGSTYDLVERRFVIAHPAQDVFVHHISGLYENVSSYVFQSSNAHGQLMALAAGGSSLVGSEIDPGHLYELSPDGEPVLRNDWQVTLPKIPNEETKSILAYRCQEATEVILTFYAKRASTLAGSRDLCVSGGAFLNINANTAIWRASSGAGVFVPSSPHDAGIAMGCAYHGWRVLCPRSRSRRVQTDAVGPLSSPSSVQKALERYDHAVDVSDLNESKIAELIGQSKIIARLSGRSEFGPRALGHRSLLADPRDAMVKDRLNVIKGRQAWRPVAPIVALDRVSQYFEGPPESPWMNMSYLVRPEFRELLPALEHPDHSTRPQTVSPEQDPRLYSLLMEFERLSGLPILVNTSLNRRGEPIVETMAEGLEMFLDRRDIDYLITDDLLIARKLETSANNRSYRLNKGAILVRSYDAEIEVLSLIYGENVWRINATVFSLLERAGREPIFIASGKDQTGGGFMNNSAFTIFVESGALTPE